MTMRQLSNLLSGGGPLLIVAAHPDDEVIGVGGHLHRLEEPFIVHTTDGAPRGSSDRVKYASTRRHEVERAVAIGGVLPDHLRTLGAVDQESIYAVTTMTTLLRELIDDIRPRAIVTHPYEGGHPDHDAAAFAVSAVVKQIEQEGGWVPAVIEFASYHNGNPMGEPWMKVGEFLPGAGEVETVCLSPESRERKQQMLACFESQQEMLAKFPAGVERFRLAPRYDFSRPPHEGPLFYETQNWGVGTEWRRLAMEALRSL